MDGDSTRRIRGWRRFAPAAGALLVVLVLATIGFSRLGCSNHHTPAGHVGYVKSRPIVGAGEFVGIQRGPTSTGWAWRQHVINIDVRARTFSEEMTIPTRERLELALTAHARIRIRPDRVRELVEQLGGEKWYATNVRDQYRATVRDKVQKLGVFEVKHEMRRVGDEVLADLNGRYRDTPVEFLSVDVGDIVYPAGVVESVVAKFVTSEENERRDIELEIARRQIEIGTAEARGIADAQRVIRATLDPMFLQFDALRAIEDLAAAGKRTFLLMPFSREPLRPIPTSDGAR